MSLPAGPDAQKKLAYYRRLRRRTKQDEKAFELLAATPHDFGSQAAGVGDVGHVQRHDQRPAQLGQLRDEI